MTAAVVEWGRKVPAIGIVIGVWLLCIVLVLGNEPVSDEIAHLGQAIGFADGDFELDETITILPGYHAVIAVPLALFGSESADIARFTTMAIALVGLWLMHEATREGTESFVENGKALQWALIPVAAPYAFLIFTDQLAAVTTLGVWLLLRRDRITEAGLAATLAVLVRQTNLGWVAVMCAVDLVVRSGSLGAAWATLRNPRHLVRYWSFLIPIGIVLAILVDTGTVAIGDTDIHRVGVYVENPLFMVMVCGGLFWPLLLDRVPPAGRALRVWGGAAIAAVVVYLALWDPDHVFNAFGGTRFARNWLLTNSIERVPVQVVLLVALVFGFFVLSHLRLPAHVAVVFYPLAVLPVVLQELVEQRYYIVPLMLLQILRRPGSARAERLLLAWWAAVMVAIAVAMFGVDKLVI